MELSNLLSDEHSTNIHMSGYSAAEIHSRTHSYPTRQTMSVTNINNTDNGSRSSPAPQADTKSDVNITHNITMSLQGPVAPKSVAFELLFPESPQFRARLPMRVQIYPHDTTESIITTVKNFYGLYAGPGGAKGVSFEDVQGNTLIAQYENLQNNMVVYVRVIEEPSSMNAKYQPPSYHSASPVGQQDYIIDESQQMLPPQPAQALSYGQPPSRPTSRTSVKRSVSPTGRGRRIDSTPANFQVSKKPRSRSGYKSRGSSTHGSFAEMQSDVLNGYSSGDGAGSVSSRTKSDHLGNTEISLDNIVEGGRRKRAKFESSELPLFAPPQMPAATSNSSVSPARRIEHQRASLPYTHPAQNPFAHPQLMQSPQSYGNGFGQPGIYSTPASDGRRTRGTTYSQPRISIGMTPNGNALGILPTPDPTVGSCMSEEDKDVALQLMRLGEMTNISHGRTSASTLDDTFSGKADAASSTGATSDDENDSEDELPPNRRPKLEGSPNVFLAPIKRFGKHIDNQLPSQDGTDFSGEDGDLEDCRDDSFKPETQSDSVDQLEHVIKAKLPKGRILPQSMGKPRNSNFASNTTKISKSGKSHRPGHASKSKSKNSNSHGGSRTPISPTSLPPQSRKASASSALNFQHQLGDDEEDLSSKPRCQRCRKSKKGCDRQRPCQRCKDAGLSADQCVSEDEGNGRKGRYGRHMGVPVKKDELTNNGGLLPSGIMAGIVGNADRSKKRKR